MEPLVPCQCCPLSDPRSHCTMIWTRLVHISHGQAFLNRFPSCRFKFLWEPWIVDHKLHQHCAKCHLRLAQPPNTLSSLIPVTLRCSSLARFSCQHYFPPWHLHHYRTSHLKRGTFLWFVHFSCVCGQLLILSDLKAVVVAGFISALLAFALLLRILVSPSLLHLSYFNKSPQFSV